MRVTSFQRAQRPVKRRKVDSSGGESDFFASSGIIARGDQGTDDKENEDTEKTRTKSKHKIHIINNCELPTYAFFAQSPQRSFNSYRIDQFHWRKSRKSSHHYRFTGCPPKGSKRLRISPDRMTRAWAPLPTNLTQNPVRMDLDATTLQMISRNLLTCLIKPGRSREKGKFSPWGWGMGTPSKYTWKMETPWN